MEKIYVGKISNWELNRTDEQGNIITGYQDTANNVTREQAIEDYLYFLKTAELIENPECECIKLIGKILYHL